MLDHWQPETADPRGQISFPGGITNVPGQVAFEQNSFAAALLGLTSGYSTSIQFFDMRNREWQLAWFFRDRWQVSRNLTLNLGLRYVYFPPINRGERGIERWDPDTNIVYFGGLGAAPRNAGITVSKRLSAPRIGFAYRMGDRNVLRAGYGLTFDPVPFSRLLRGLYPATLTGSWIPSVNVFGYFNSLDQGIPDLPTPDLSRGQLMLPVKLNMGPRSPRGGRLNRGYIQSWNMTLERRLPWEMIGSAGYAATRTIGQLLDRNINTVGPGLGITTANLPLAQAHGRTIGMNMWDGWGYATDDSLQATLDKRFSNGLFAKLSYTFGKALNMADDTGWAGPKAFNWEGMLDRNYSPASYNRPHTFTSALARELPFGKERRFNLEGIANQVLGGWSMNGTFYVYAGTPFTVTGSSQSLQCIGCTQTAHQIGPVKKPGAKRSGTALLRPVAVPRSAVLLQPGESGLHAGFDGHQQHARTRLLAVEPGHLQELPDHRAGENGVPRRIQQHRSQHPLGQPVRQLRGHAAQSRRLAAQCAGPAAQLHVHHQRGLLPAVPLRFAAVVLNWRAMHNRATPERWRA
jgi:hypothetical protein